MSRYGTGESDGTARDGLRSNFGNRSNFLLAVTITEPIFIKVTTKPSYRSKGLETHVYIAGVYILIPLIKPRLVVFLTLRSLQLRLRLKYLTYDSVKIIRLEVNKHGNG